MSGRVIPTAAMAGAGVILGGYATLRAAEKNPIPFPHPQITEVLFNVPTGEKGDANKDGVRDAAGDEFIEIANPHDEPIQLGGYILTNRRASVKGTTTSGVRFVFPKMELPPHAIVVIFNGFDAKIADPVGDSDDAPTAVSPHFGKSWALTMKIDNKGKALANSGDWLLLSAPDGTPIDCVWWGEPDPPAPTTPLRIQEVSKETTGSVQRIRPSGDLEPHNEINGELFSPGIIPAGKK